MYDTTLSTIIIDKVLQDVQIANHSISNSSHWRTQLIRLVAFSANVTKKLHEIAPAAASQSIAYKYLYLLQKIIIFVEFERIAERNAQQQQVNAFDEFVVASLQGNVLWVIVLNEFKYIER